LKEMPVEPIKAFLAAFENHYLSPLTDTGPVLRYIADRQDSELALWDVVFAGVQDSENMSAKSLGLPLYCQQRTAGIRTNSDTIYVSNKQRVASRGMERLGLSEDSAAAAESGFREDPANKKSSTNQWNYPDRIYRARRVRPLLIVHLLDITEIKAELRQRVDSQPIVAWSISFPNTQRPEDEVEYVVTTQWLRENKPAEDEDAIDDTDLD
ncbi:MAG: hypothetical protein ABI142_09270, partial [Bryocella sp.]